MDYNSFAKTFSNSRKNMKWEEIDYFLEFISERKIPPIPFINGILKGDYILDIGCGNGRLINSLENKYLNLEYYLGVDLSKGLLEEAKDLHSDYDFLEINMLEIYKVNKKFDFIFFIASFHHLENLEEREKVIKYAKNLLKKDGIIFMTNWSLNSEINLEKYKNMIVLGSENQFGSIDYNIKIGEFARFYHCFSLEELEYLSKNSNLEIIENRLFDNKKNIISIFRKK